MSGDNSSVKVALRVRPLVPSEIQKGCNSILEVHKDIQQVRIKDTDKAFTYNFVLDADDDQETLYSSCVRDMIPNLFRGYNMTILAYGQTGSGKTHSMGTSYNGSDNVGVIPRCIHDIFKYVKDNFTLDFTITVSFMELYQEVLYDLLSNKARDQCSLDIREDAKGIHMPGLTEVPVVSAGEVFDCLMKGSAGRATGATNMNSQSSRSHAIFTINICVQNKNDSTENKTAKFHLVDLAGSERAKKTGTVGNAFKEGVNINKGLLVLGNVISALGDEKQQNFVPYRDSNLTRLLKDSLGGNSITLMIACVSPADYNLEETLSTLRYADRARRIKNKPIINQDAHAAQLNELKKTIKQLKLQIVGQGGPVICPAEVELLKKQISDLELEKRNTNLQMSNLIRDKTGLIEKVMLLQNMNEALVSKMNVIRDKYNVTLQDISSAMENNPDDMKQTLLKFQEIKNSFHEIEVEQKRTEDAIRASDETFVINNMSKEACEDIQDMQQDHANRQIQLNDELQVISRNLMIKQHLAQQLASNTKYLVDYDVLTETQSRIAQLEKERDELLQQLKSAQGQPTSSKIAEQRRKKVQELESQIQDLSKKLNEQNKLIRLKHKDEEKIKQLNHEIQQMKQAKVKLIRNMKEETEKFNRWKAKRERELTKLKQQDMKKQTQIAKMTVMHTKQQNVLRRKLEETAALNKRLKEMFSKRAQVHEAKAGKVERLVPWGLSNSRRGSKLRHSLNTTDASTLEQLRQVSEWIKLILPLKKSKSAPNNSSFVKHELDVYVTLTEAEVRLKALLEDRSTLQQQLDALRATSDEDDLEEIKAVEEDIELRTLQIQELQQKLLESEDAKNKNKFDVIQNMAEAKFLVNYLFDHIAEVKKREVSTNLKLLEVDTVQHEVQEQILALQKQNIELSQRKAEMESRLHQEYEEKVAVLLRQLRGIEVQTKDEDLSKRCRIQAEKIEELEDILENYRLELETLKSELKEQINKKPEEKPEIIGNVATPAQDTDDFETPKKEKTKKAKTKKSQDDTFTVDKENEFVELDESIGLICDDDPNDPDWRKTPLGKRVLQQKKRLTEISQSTAALAEKSTCKRSSDGGCACSQRCSNRCGCRKLGKVCGLSCKCKPEICINREESSNNESSDSSDLKTANNVFKRPRLQPRPIQLPDQYFERN